MGHSLRATPSMRGRIRAYGSPRSWKNKCVIIVQYVGAPARHRASFATGAYTHRAPPDGHGPTHRIFIAMQVSAAW
jgi:hypothetical protein